MEGRGQGRLDSPLTELGIQQARASDASNPALTTACLALDGLAVPLTVLDDLAEVDMGEVAGLLPSERLARFPLLAEAWKVPHGSARRREL
nr:histidine phosphatase family protein [Deinococcus sp. AJ005]